MMRNANESPVAGVLLLLFLGQDTSPRAARVEPEVPPAWMARVSENIRREEYGYARVAPGS